MRILTRYLVKDYLVTFGVTVAVFTFVMTLGAVIKAIDLLARGVAGGLILQFFALNIPFVLQFTIPMATMTTSLLLFTRLSLDGEITALKACGMSLWNIVTPLLWSALLLTAASLWLSGEVSPRCRFAQRSILTRLANTDPLALVEEGKFVRDFPGFLLYVGKRNGEMIEDIVIYELAENKVRGNVRAKSGRITVDPVNQKLRVDLYDARIDQSGARGSGSSKGPRSFSAAHYPRELDFKEVFRTGRKAKRNSDRTTGELVRGLRDPSPAPSPDLERREKMGMVVEISVRAALSFGCFGFTLLGIPLGIRSRRKESSVGVGLSLGILFLFYFFMILARSMSKFPEWMPDLLVWFPLLVAQVAGWGLIRRMN